MYYHRLDVRQAIVDFANAGGNGCFREGAFYNSRAKSLQRYLADGEVRRPVMLGKPGELDRALKLGASAFYCSNWRYQGQDLSRPAGSDLVWAIRAKRGGLEFAKAATILVLEAVESAGVSEPWVKYSGALGFDLILPLEMIPREAIVGGLSGLAGLQGELTSYVGGYLCERFPEISVGGVTSPIEIKKGEKTCVFSEFRARRGLLLAPMSICPETGLVSVQVDPREIDRFSVLEASPENARALGWEQPPKLARGLLRFIHPWEPDSVKARLAVA
jgi:hypothetical protein